VCNARGTDRVIRNGTGFHRVRETQEQKRQRAPQGGIQKHYGAVALDMRQRRALQDLRQAAATKRA